MKEKNMWIKTQALIEEGLNKHALLDKIHKIKMARVNAKMNKEILLKKNKPERSERVKIKSAVSKEEVYKPSIEHLEEKEQKILQFLNEARTENYKIKRDIKQEHHDFI